MTPTDIDRAGGDAFLRHQRTRTAAFYREFPPSADLAELVACGWIHVVRHGGATLAAVPVIPDGCADIVVYDDGPALLVGPDTRTRWPHLPDGLVITGLRLRPGALRAVAGAAVRELLDVTVELADVKSTARRLRGELHTAGTLAARMARLEAWVRGHVTTSERDRAVIAACRALALGNGGPDVGRVATALGWNARMLHREFVSACGYGPKHMQRVLRLQRALRSAHAASEASPRLSDVAAAAGFADQAHMTRDFRAITGFAPRDYLARAEPGLGCWLTEPWSEP